MTRRSATTTTKPWHWSVVSTPIIAAAAVYTAGAVLDELAAPAVYVGLVTAFATGSAAVACGKAQPGRFASVYAVGVSLATGVWLTWAAATTAWSGHAVTVLLCGLGFLGPLWFLARHTHYRKRMKEDEDERRRFAAAEARRWPEMLTNLGLPNLSKWAGPHDAAFTMKTYVHATDEDLETGSATLGKLYQLDEQP